VESRTVGGRGREGRKGRLAPCAQGIDAPRVEGLSPSFKGGWKAMPRPHSAPGSLSGA